MAPAHPICGLCCRSAPACNEADAPYDRGGAAHRHPRATISSMPAPVIRFAVMADGGRVAFQVLGSGSPVAILFPFHINHLELNWRVPLHRGAMEFLARQFAVINLDFRGAGLSDPLPGALSLDSFFDALSAVFAEIGVSRVGIVAMGAAGMIACDFANRDPQNAARIVFISSGASDANRQLLHLRQSTPEVEAQLRGALLGGVGDRRNANALAEAARASLDLPALSQWERLLQEVQQGSCTRPVTVPVLYLHAADDHLVPLAAAQSFVAPMSDARLKIVPGKSGMDVWRNRAAVDEVVRFLRSGESRAMARRTRGAKSEAPAGLSPREMEVVRLLASGRTNRQIAEELFISLNTVSHHLRNVFAKTGTSNRTEAAAFAFEAGLAERSSPKT
jgi:DNA-binding CsgD family transcriptional regulator/pimeloyl-ACP methyl ester carboxylesterase